MVAKSKSMGHNIVCESGEDWFPLDHTVDPNKCNYCGLRGSEGAPDPCVGYIKGVTSACCGHCMFDEALVVFEDGVSVFGLEAYAYLSKVKKDD